MKLLEKPDSSSINKPDLVTGSGNFLIDGGDGHRDKTVTVFYHMPEGFTKGSPVMLVVPGSGRNGWDYRDAWVDASEKRNLLILSLHYPESDYPEFWSYNIGGMIDEVKINEERTAMLDYTLVKNPKEWIWEDFDRMFLMVKEKLNLETDTYDMFGHSAGGQIVHRLTLFNTNNHANRLLASNSGWYTVPTYREPFPYGLKESAATSGQVKSALAKQLVLFLGENDNENETRGHLVRSPETNRQGTHRLARGTYFYRKAKALADSMNVPFNWKLKVVPDVGHNYRKMSEEAAGLLYGN